MKINWYDAEEYSDMLVRFSNDQYQMHGNPLLVFATLLLTLEKWMSTAPSTQQPTSFVVVREAVSSCIADMKLNTDDKS